jgi:hypothetical protein
VCGYVATGFPTNQVTATTDSPVAAHVPHLNYKAVMAAGRPAGFTTVYCQDRWGAVEVQFTPCLLRGRLVLSVTKKVKRRLGLTSTILASVKLKPFVENQFYAPVTFPKKVVTAMNHYKVFAMTMKATITSPTSTTFSSTSANARRGVCGGTYVGVCKGYGG